MGATKYNGVILPDLPDYDKATYPYALIVNDGSRFILLVCSEPFTQDRYYPDAVNYYNRAKIAGYSVLDYGSAYEWFRGEIIKDGENNVGDYRFRGEYVWSNHEISLAEMDIPKLPTWNQAEYPYLVIEQIDRSYSALFNIPDYIAYYSATPFTATSLANGVYFRCNSDMYGKQEMDFTYVSESESAIETDGWTVGEGGQFVNVVAGAENVATAEFITNDGGTWKNVWANHDVFDATGEVICEANSWYNLVFREEGTTEDVPVSAPTNVVAEGGGTYNQFDTALVMTCTADSPEGGTLSYKWYMNGTVCGYDSLHIPSTATAGTFEYYCVVTNSQYGEKLTAESERLTVVVTAVELPDAPDDTEATQEAAKTRSKKHCIGYVLKQCGVPMAELIAEMIAGIKKKTAALYLYGTPVEDGVELSEYRHVGLRVGDTVTYYRALIAPPLPKETAIYSACVMAEFTRTPWLFAGKSVTYETYNGKYHFALAELQPYWLGHADGWQQSTYIPTHNRIGEVGSDFAIWSSVDILYEDGTVAHAATDPIPVGEIVDYINDIPIYEDLR